MVRFHTSFITPTVPAITRSRCFPGRLALELSKPKAVHVKEQGEHPVDCEWLLPALIAGMLFPECSIGIEQLHIRCVLLLL
jgi:hypothetical protein